MKRVLMIAYHFPPLAGSSGIQRTLRFVQHLPKFDWQPMVLTANPLAYERTSVDLDAEIPPGTIVRRAFALDTARHLALGGRYWSALARPDRWVSWRFAAVRAGMRMIREFSPQAIWSTFPIATAHSIAGELHRKSGVPWIADFRDPMAQQGYPTDPRTWQSYERIESRAVQEARYSIFTAPSAVRMYRERYKTHADRVVLLENGFDEETFSAAERSASLDEPLNSGAVTLLHSGIVYPEERDPTQLFVALGRLAASGLVVPGQIKIRFRASVHEELLLRLAATHRVEEFVEVCAPTGYQNALVEMLRADGLLVMQSAGCNEQIPAKIYEYLRARKAILCLSDPAGDTACALRAAGVRATARLDSAEEIEAALLAFVDGLRAKTTELPDLAAVRAASRESRTQTLAKWLDEVSR
jgi:glycosyltransferase involved in cell wall biosynthesis